MCAHDQWLEHHLYCLTLSKSHMTKGTVPNLTQQRKTDAQPLPIVFCSSGSLALTSLCGFFPRI